MKYERLTVTIPMETLVKLQKASKKERRAVSNMVTWLIEKYVEENEIKV